MGSGGSTAKGSSSGASPSKSSKSKRSSRDTRTPEQKRAAWVHFQRELPRTKSDEDKERRIDLFEKWDVTERGSLTVREVYDGCKRSLFLHDFTPRLPDIVERAFNKAKDVGNKATGQGDERMIEFLEFRLMLCYIYDYFKLTEMFDEMDVSGNMLITASEFARAKPSLESWGLHVGDPATTFRKIDTNGSGQMTFDEFAAWAQKQKKDIDSEYGTASRSVRESNDPSGANEAPEPEKEPQTEAFVNPAIAQRRAAWARIREVIPRKRTPEDKERRIELFKQFDKDGSGALTLSETYKGCVLILHLDEFTPRLKDIVKRAYKKARTLGTTTEGHGDAHKVEFLEFRLMLCYIYDYFELTVMFDEIDTSGNGLIDRSEFSKAVEMLAEWGVPVNDPNDVFSKIDGNNSGQITFDEFAAWASSVKLDVDGDPDNVH